MKLHLRIALSLICVSGWSVSDLAAADCDHVGAYIVNLSRDDYDLSQGIVCSSKSTDFSIEECIADQIEDQIGDGFSADCLDNIDVFVPGTASEHGAWKAFNHIFRTDNNRAHLSLQYNDDRDVEADNNLDGAWYDNGVIEASKSLDNLLEALKRRFNPDSIRVFGHSKGSHAVALVAEQAEFTGIQFYAFAQPGRTDQYIDSILNIEGAELGTPGYIEKLSDNLVGITWKNDEVQYYTGYGTNDIHVPEIWSFPGFIWQRDGFGDILEFRIDHHNNYGGNYTDGYGSNNWREGDGTIKNNYPYCATGDRWALDQSECNKENTHFSPWFWGTPECQAEAFRMMARGGIGDRYKIGNSGPREFGSCRESTQLIEVDYYVRYQMDIPDNDCRQYMRFGFEDANTGKEISTFRYNVTTDNDQTWHEKTGTRFVPYHMNLTLSSWIEEMDEGIGDCNAAGTIQSELFISSLKLSFIHPGTGRSQNRTIVGLREGRGADLLGDDLHKWDNVAWEQPGRSSEELKMYYWGPYHSIKIEGEAEAGHEGEFEKRVHLLD